MKSAILQAATLVVICPHCRTDQLSPEPLFGNNSHVWAISQVVQYPGERTCNTCAEKYELLPQLKVQIAS